jgi:putative tryptophan/tyrosine transport system substrate-binding protein
MNRRDFVAALGGAATWSLAAGAQQPNRVRHVGVSIGWNESDQEAQSNLAAFIQRFQELGWTEGQNVRFAYRWANGDVNRMRMFAKELVGLQPDAIVSVTTPATAALHRETKAIPIVFVVVSDPVGAGFVTSLARPNGNITGFINIEGSLGGKWLRLLKEIAPDIKRAAIMFNPDTAPGGGSYFLDSFQTAAQSLSVEPAVTAVRSDAEIETAISSLGDQRSGLVLMTDGFITNHRRTIISAAARNRVPAIYAEAFSPRDGGLLSYGANYRDLFRLAAGYVDRILRGATPNDLPVQLPTRFELVINVKTVKALGLDLPLMLQAQADEVIE